MKGSALMLAAAISAGGVGVLAHHSLWVLYDSSRRVTLDGTVVEFQLVNPHPFLVIEVQDAGVARPWRLEMDNRHELAAIGITARTFRPGEAFTVSVSPARAQAQSLYLLRLDRPADGFWYEQVGQSPRISSSSK